MIDWYSLLVDNMGLVVGVTGTGLSVAVFARSFAVLVEAFFDLAPSSMEPTQPDNTMASPHYH